MLHYVSSCICLGALLILSQGGISVQLLLYPAGNAGVYLRLLAVRLAGYYGQAGVRCFSDPDLQGNLQASNDLLKGYKHHGAPGSSLLWTHEPRDRPSRHLETPIFT